jgi:hypothetical protein
MPLEDEIVARVEERLGGKIVVSLDDETIEKIAAATVHRLALVGEVKNIRQKSIIRG